MRKYGSYDQKESVSEYKYFGQIILSLSIIEGDLDKNREKFITYILSIIYNIKMKNCCIIIFLLAFTTYQETYNLVKLTDHQALCLDGSPGAYYLSKGDPSKVILYFEGGGWCGGKDQASTIENCYLRSKSPLGSSSSYAPTMMQTSGLLSDQDENYFKNWTKAYLKYCDGTGHQGSRSNPLSYKGASIYFRGQNVTKSQLDSLESQINLFSKVEKILVSGGSAGGLATFTWTNYIKGKATGKVWSAPDSGIFLDEKNVVINDNLYRIQIQNFMSLSNAQVDPPVPECVAQYPTEKYKCMFAQYIHKFITAPLFPIQSLYDTWSIPNILGLNCLKGNILTNCNSTQTQQIEDYHRATTNVLFEIGQKDGNGFWAPACLDHVYSQGSKYTSANYRVPMLTEFSENRCLSDWMEGISDPFSHKHIDMGKWPSNMPCSGTISSLRID